MKIVDRIDMWIGVVGARQPELADCLRMAKAEIRRINAIEERASAAEHREMYGRQSAAPEKAIVHDELSQS